jgi:hypothetical protein
MINSNKIYLPFTEVVTLFTSVVGIWINFKKLVCRRNHQFSFIYLESNDIFYFNFVILLFKEGWFGNFFLIWLFLFQTFLLRLFKNRSFIWYLGTITSHFGNEMWVFLFIAFREA